MKLLCSARKPPAGLADLDPVWSRLIQAPDFAGVSRTWHVLDSYALELQRRPRLTLLCVHGNPTWSYLWRQLLRQAPADVRVVAVDQLDMGFSERTGVRRRLAERVADLRSLTDVMGISGPVVTVAHDWGGPISLGWAQQHCGVLDPTGHTVGVILLNTAVSQPKGSPAPAIIALARSRPLLRTNTVRTDLFIRGTLAMSGSSMARSTAEAFRAPYGDSSLRHAIGDFVADIPLESSHPSRATLDLIAHGLDGLSEIPVLLLWGPGDLVFSDLYLQDLIRRMPHADVHRYEGARHLVIEDDARVVPDMLTWLQKLFLSESPLPQEVAGLNQPETHEPERLWSGLHLASSGNPDGLAMVEMGSGRRVTWSAFAADVDTIASRLHARGIREGHRVSLLIPPGADLIATVYACWRIGACVVIADAGLGVKGIRRALRGAAPDHVIGIRRGLILARTLRIPGLRLSVGEVCQPGSSGHIPPEPPDSSDAVVVFTSGATGPAKGVVYRQSQIASTRDVLRQHYGLTENDSIVAAFAPWAVFGPTLGIASVIPDMDVTRPRTLQSTALADATAAVKGTLLWASPAALTNVVATSAALSDGQRRAFTSLRLVLAAGAPIPLSLLEHVHSLIPNAQVRTPYGMTEVLPVSDVTLDEIRQASGDAQFAGSGVLVGRPVRGVDVMISALDHTSCPSGPMVTAPEVTGEICVRAAHMRDHYDRLWATNAAASRDVGWHRTGDVGHLDGQGRLWVEGRLAHVISTSAGSVTPVGIEQRVQGLPFVQLAAAVGVGPKGAQVVVVVITMKPSWSSTVPRAGRQLEYEMATEVRRCVADLDIAAVLVRRELPVDIRHNSKIDRAELAGWATGFLEGHCR